MLLEMKRKGFTPDTVLAHPGWGESLYVKDVFPDARLVHYCEWYYNAEGADLGFDPEFPITFDDRARIRTWNALHALNLTQLRCGRDADALAEEPPSGDLPAQDHRAARGHRHREPRRRPERLRSRTPNGTVLKAGDPVVTYVARNLEPYRGFHIFMRALEKLQQQHKTVHALIVGGDDVSYGKRPKEAKNWREKMLREVKLDATRTHFLGKLPRAQYIKVLQVSAAHVYLTYPFVLSWSLLEAMACGATSWRVIRRRCAKWFGTGRTGCWCAFFDASAVVNRLAEQIASGREQATFAMRARATAAAFSLLRGSEGYASLLDATIERTWPSNTTRTSATDLNLLEMST